MPTALLIFGIAAAIAGPLVTLAAVIIQQRQNHS